MKRLFGAVLGRIKYRHMITRKKTGLWFSLLFFIVSVFCFSLQPFVLSDAEDNPVDITKLAVKQNRSEYTSDESYANFRMITVGNIAEGVLYRSSSPVGAAMGEVRSQIADKLARKVGIQTVMNLAFTQDDIHSILADEEHDALYYKELYDEHKVFAEALLFNYRDPTFYEGFARGIRFLAENNPPYLLHCHGGKDRTGFTAMILEMLMGADKEEIIGDYMQTYINFYDILPDTSYYESIQNQTIIRNMDSIIQDFGTGSARGNYQEAANSYLLSIGLKQDDIDRLIYKLKKNK